MRQWYYNAVIAGAVAAADISCVGGFESRSALRSSARSGHVGYLALPQVESARNRRGFE
jgi:hypothetical protein